MANVLRFKQEFVNRQQGELARLKVVAGADAGAVYVITGSRVFMGRGEENDLVLADLKASRVHAEMHASVGGWVIKDQGSVNGILHNGQASREARLQINDTITIGETILEFSTSDVATQMLVAPPKSIDQVDAEHRNLQEHKKSLGRFGLGALFQSTSSITGVEAAGAGAEGAKKEKNRRMLLLGVGGVLVAFLIFGDNGERKPAESKSSVVPPGGVSNLAAFLPEAPYNKEVEMIFKDGLREYFSENYNRARTQFETVLQIMPEHSMAILYLENCNQKIEGDVKLHLEQGKKAFQAGKLRDARAHFMRILRLLYKDQTNPMFIEATDQLEQVNKSISRGVKGG